MSHVTIATEDIRGRMLIRGEWVDGADLLPVTNPYDGSVVGAVPQASRDEVDLALSAAERGAKTMGALPAHERARILSRTAERIEGHQDELAALNVRESGKSLRYACGETARAAQTFLFAAEEAKRNPGEVLPMDAALGAERCIGYYYREPLGVVAAITPFNYPLNLVAHKVAPAIAAGNSVVLKPAEVTPLIATRLVELLLEAGLPPEGIHLLHGRGATVGAWLVADPRPAMITFTGSAAVGKVIQQEAGLKRLTLELGSNSAVIVAADADLEAAVANLVPGAFANAGQDCASVQRIFVQEGIAEAFTHRFVAATSRLHVGDPMNPENDVGPMISEEAAKRAEAWVAEAVAGGAKLLTGGGRRMGILDPTVLTGVTREMKVFCQEVFAPVVSIIRFRDLEEAIALVNDSVYGLTAGVFTRTIATAFRAIRGIRAGAVLVNENCSWRADHMPYGGVKETGLGREGLAFAVAEMSNLKMVSFNL